MRIKLQLILCDDDGHEETITDVVTLKKDHRRLKQLGLTLQEAKQVRNGIQKRLRQRQVAAVSGPMLVLPGLRRSAQSQRLPYPLVPHSVWHLQTGQSAALPLPLHTPQDDLVSPPILAPHRVRRPRVALYGDEVVLPGVVWHDGQCPQGLPAP
jgi:hypothetical protein